LEDIRLESFLADDLGLESLEEVEAIFAIEEELAVRFPSDTDVNFPETVRDIVEYVRRCRVEQ
jgi:acyl carrier protein